VAKEQRLLKIDHLKEQPADPFISGLVANEGFVSYMGVPLIIKGKVKAVLELYHRAELHPYAEWLDFLNKLTGQAVIAIENASLVTNLEQSNHELSQAYDATIEGWSRALDLRDKETEGHSQRVTQMTVSLARAFGLGEAELVQVRRGSLLHDIGKMGVPDAILFKPSKLTDEEWVAMKMHPTFAYDLLAPVHYLQLALDIPYCHHEKWDGSGYPRGLKAEQIPRAARMFAVVDVWDALCSDRPYRSGWAKEKVREHILASAGTHFDPQVVDGFMKLIEQAEHAS
jgi:HD-GYP domain-containing protein (c-di-GMP phosphodiesterase class II)